MSNEDFAGAYLAVGTLMGDTLSVYKKDGSVMFFASGYGMLMAANSGTYVLEGDKVIATVVPLIRPNGEVNSIEGTVLPEMIFHDNSGTRASDYYEFLIAKDISFFDDVDFAKAQSKADMSSGRGIAIGDGGAISGELAEWVSNHIKDNKPQVKEKSEKKKSERSAEKSSCTDDSTCADAITETDGNEAAICAGTGNEEKEVEITKEQVYSGAVTVKDYINSLFGGKSSKSIIPYEYTYGFSISMSLYITEAASYKEYYIFAFTNGGNVKRLAVSPLGGSDQDSWKVLLEKMKEVATEVKYFCFLEGCGPNFPAKDLFAEVLPKVGYCTNIGQIPNDEPLSIESIHAFQDLFRAVRKNMLDCETEASCLTSLIEQLKNLSPDSEFVMI